VRTHGGKVLYARDQQSLGRIVEPRYVAMMNGMMRETLLIGTAQKAQLPGWPAAGKTGTSQDFRDAWFIGYTGHLVTGVWLGNDDSSPTKKATGGGLPVEIWTHFMKVAHQGVPVAALPGLVGTPALASMFPPWGNPAPAAPVAAQGSSQTGGHASGQGGGQGNAQAYGQPTRPAPINSGLDSSFLDRIFGRH
jgi:penicillin-binding protein 1A